MAIKSPGRKRPVNVVVDFPFEEFCQRLARAVCWSGDISCLVHGGRVVPGSHGQADASALAAGQFSVDYLFQELLSKYDDGLPSPSKEETTWRRFHEAEELCRTTNHRLKYDRSRYSTSATSVWSYIHRARQKISHTLGEFRWNDAAVHFAWGPGATTRLPRRRADAIHKFSGSPETTSGNVALAMAAIAGIPLWKESLLGDESTGYCKIVPGNRIVTVPKNYKADRTIAIEPCMNMYVQKGIGGLMRRKLRRVGVDLDDQTNNQELARYGSVLGHLSTVDLSMASDTVSYDLVRLLLPPDWMEALEQCRSPSGTLPSGDTVYYQKFSSMGNGYTFDLESLVFWALGCAVAEVHGWESHHVSVFGDDIIFPAEITDKLVECFDYLGFRTNSSKTFVSGPFRESCGKHYFSGHDVTPLYIKKRPTHLTDLFLVHNQVYRWCGRNRWNEVWNRQEVSSLLSWLRSFAPSPWRRPRLPDEYGDGAFIGTFDEALPRLNKKFAERGYEGFSVDVILEGSSYVERDCLGRLLKSLSFLEGRGSDRLTCLSGTDWRGGDPLPQRARVNNILVRQFATLNPF